MTAIVDVIVPADDFPLGRALKPVSEGARFELGRMIPTTDRIIPFLFVEGADIEELEARLGTDETIDEVTILDNTGSEALIRLEWPTGVDGFVQAVNDHGAAILEGIGTKDRWAFKLRFPDTADISAFRVDCVDSGVNLDLQRLYHPDDPDVDTSGLTPLQRETLLAALKEGYFAIPRRITAEKLGEKLGISDQAVSERIRRAETTVFTSLLLVNDDPDIDVDTDIE